MCIRDRSYHTPEEDAEFRAALAVITECYLTARVLILLDNTYFGRFWTLMEAWCAMQTTTPNGVRPATLEEARYSIVCLHNARRDRDPAKLVDLVSTKTPEEMRAVLASPDVCVTNARDKALFLPAVADADRRVRRLAE